MRIAYTCLGICCAASCFCIMRVAYCMYWFTTGCAASVFCVGRFSKPPPDWKSINSAGRKNSICRPNTVGRYPRCIVEPVIIKPSHQLQYPFTHHALRNTINSLTTKNLQYFLLFVMHSMQSVKSAHRLPGSAGIAKLWCNHRFSCIHWMAAAARLAAPMGNASSSRRKVEVCTG